jgi:hypothetical protein
LLGREQNTVEINTDGGERHPLAADFFVGDFSTGGAAGALARTTQNRTKSEAKPGIE